MRKCQKRPIHIAKEAYGHWYSAKRDLFILQKRPMGIGTPERLRGPCLTHFLFLRKVRDDVRQGEGGRAEQPVQPPFVTVPHLEGERWREGHRRRERKSARRIESWVLVSLQLGTRHMCHAHTHTPTHHLGDAQQHSSISEYLPSESAGVVWGTKADGVQCLLGNAG